jgi:VWFA-related protein
MLAASQATVDVHRTVYVTATNQAGDHVLDLTAADLTVKEDGRERQILEVRPSTAPLKVALAIDELLAPYTVVRQAAWQFFQHLDQHGEMALYLVGRRNEQRVDYTSDFVPFWDAINAFPVRPRYPGNLVESLHEIARAQRSLEGRRAIVALAPEIAQLSNVTANAVFDALRETGAVFYAVTIMSTSDAAPTLEESPTTRLEGGDLTQQVERDRVLGDGTKQSGGLRLSSVRVEAFPAALDQVAGDLLHQYTVTYLVPAGTESDGNLSIETERRGLTVRGPRRVPKL